MSKQFELRLVGASSPDGELDADDLLAIVKGLKEIATKLGRDETDAEPLGRPSKRTKSVARLTIGLAPGSTKVLVRRADASETLDFDLLEEENFDDKFEALVLAIAKDERPNWVHDSLATAAGDLRLALERAAPVVELSVNQKPLQTFETSTTNRSTWSGQDAKDSDEILAFIGTLRAVNLDTHRLQVTDDVGNRVALPEVADDTKVGRLLGKYVKVVGAPERDSRGKVVQLMGASINAAPVVNGIPESLEPVSLDDLLLRAPGPELGGIPNLSDKEADDFLRAIGF